MHLCRLETSSTKMLNKFNYPAIFQCIIILFCSLTASSTQTLNKYDPATYNHQYATVNGIHMHYIDENPSSTNVLLLVHGWPDLYVNPTMNMIMFKREK